MLKGFKDFILKGNVIDLAIAVVMGTAFTAIVTAFSDNVINPVIAALGGSNEQGWGFRIISDNSETFVNIGKVITAGINFVLIAAVLYFLIVVPFNAAKNRMVKAGEEAAKTEAELLAEIRDLLAGSARR